jgi:hypothetical protein
MWPPATGSQKTLGPILALNAIEHRDQARPVMSGGADKGLGHNDSTARRSSSALRFPNYGIIPSIHRRFVVHPNGAKSGAFEGKRLSNHQIQCGAAFVVR